MLITSPSTMDIRLGRKVFFCNPEICKIILWDDDFVLTWVALVVSIYYCYTTWLTANSVLYLWLHSRQLHTFTTEEAYIAISSCTLHNNHCTRFSYWLKINSYNIIRRILWGGIEIEIISMGSLFWIYVLFHFSAMKAFLSLVWLL